MFGATNNVTGCVNTSFESDENCEDLEQIYASKTWYISGLCDTSVLLFKCLPYQLTCPPRMKPSLVMMVFSRKPLSEIFGIARDRNLL